MNGNELQHRVARLEGYLAQDTGNATLRAELVDLLIGLGRLADARRHAEESVRQSPADRPAQYRLAVIEHQAGDLQSARDRLARLLDEGVDEPVVRYELARVQALLGDLPAALATLQALSAQALPEALATPVALLHVRTLHRAGDLDAAIQQAERFLALQPNSPALVSALATLYVDAQRLDAAARLFDAAQQAGVADAEMLAVGGFVALDAADLAAAQSRFEQSVAQTPQFGRAQLGLGLAHAAAGRLDQAKIALTEATRAMPTHLGSWHALAWMQLLDREIDAAERSFRHALDVDDSFGDTHGGLAIVAALRGDRARAQEFIRVGHRLDRASLNVGMAMTLLQHGGAMNSQEFLDSALKMLHQHALANNPAMRAGFEKLLQARTGSGSGSGH